MMKRFVEIVALVFAINYGIAAASALAARTATPQPAPPRVQETIGESLDWLVVDRPHIAIVEVTNSALAPNNTDLAIETKLKQSLKGQPPQQASFVRRWQREATPGQEDTARPQNGTEYMLFFNDKGEVTNAMNLAYPSRKLGIGADPKDVALATDFSIYKTGDVIKEVVKHRLEQIAANKQTPPAAPEHPKRITVPLDSPAWEVLYDGNTCYLLVPNQVQEKVVHIAEFGGEMYHNECVVIAHKPFEIKSAITSQPHTLTFTCVDNPEGSAPWAPEKVFLKFRVLDVAHQGDYEFRWSEDPDALPVQKGMYSETGIRGCLETLRLLQAKIADQTIVSVEGSEGSTQMWAQWHADCVPDDRWGTSMAFYLSIKSSAK